MYKVMIVDDEPIIVEGLTKAIKWDKWNCMVVGSASDGEEGLMTIRDLKPDILFTDIRMPRIDGLSMVAGLKSEFPNMQITVLTGFREFEYAKRALELGVKRYLLKPSKFAEIEEATSVMTDTLKELPKDEAEDSDNTAGNFIVNNALDYIKAHYKEKLTLEELSEKVYVSQWHLSKLLNSRLNKNFSEILNGVRMEKAKELLENPSLRISDISEMVGFMDLSHFSRVFKKLVGVSPNEYRNNL